MGKRKHSSARLLVDRSRRWGRGGVHELHLERLLALNRENRDSHERMKGKDERPKKNGKTQPEGSLEEYRPLEVGNNALKALPQV